MAYTYIGKALATISRFSTDYCDWAGWRFTQMTAGELSTLNGSLDFGWLKWNMRNANVPQGSERAEVADWRRGAMLALKLAPNPLPQNIGWDEGDSKGTIRARLQDGARPAHGGGYYLKGSYWGFSSSSERAWTASAWTEAVDMIRFGAITASKGTARALALVQKWFGNASPADVHRVLRTVQDRIQDTPVGISYQGRGLSAAAQLPVKYRELAGGVGAADVAIGDGWGWSAPQAGGHQTIGFCPKFFNDQTRVRRTGEHDARSVEMGVTRGGAIVHELTHRFADTRDQEVPDTVYAAAGRAPPAANQARAKGYGPLTCSAMGRAEPQLAINNADSYRLFCEDAHYLKP